MTILLLTQFLFDHIVSADLGVGALIGISAAAAAATSGGQAIATGKLNRKNRAWQEKMAERQQEWNQQAADQAWQRQLEFYDKSNAYDAPDAVKKRYEDAGINPYAAFGTAGSYSPSQGLPNVDATQSSSLPHINPQGFTFQNPLDSALKLAQARNIEADTIKKQGETVEPGLNSEALRLSNSLLEKQITGQETTNDQKLFDLQFARDTRETNISKLQQSVKNMEEQAKTLNAQYLNLMDQHQRNPEVVEELKSRIWMNSARVALMSAQEDFARKGIHLTQAQIENLAQQTSNLESTKTLIEKQIETEGRKPGLIRAQQYLARMQGWLSNQNARGVKRVEDAYDSNAGAFLTELSEILKSINPLKFN